MHPNGATTEGSGWLHENDKPAPLGSLQILTPGYRAAIHCTNFSGAAMVESRPCRTSAQSSNLPDCLISASVVGGSRRAVNSNSTTADFGILRVGPRLAAHCGQPYYRGVAAAMIDEDPVVGPHLEDGAHRLWIGDAIPHSALFALQVVERIGFRVGFGEKGSHRQL
jgi:hypothetical protein